MFIRMLFSACSVSARNCGMVYGLPSPSAWIGFVHALCRQAQLLPYLRSGVTPVIQQFSINGFDEVHCNFALLRSIGRDVRDRGKQKNSEMPGTQLDTPTAYFEGGVIFELDVNEESKSNTLDDLEDAAKFMRFAGGVIEKQDGEKYCETFDSLPDAARLRAATLLEYPLNASQDILEQIIKMSTPEKGREGWFVPSLMGYRLLEEPVRNRKGARKGYPHAYADPLLGIIRVSGFHRLNYIPPRWRYDYQMEKRLILFTTQ